MLIQNNTNAHLMGASKPRLHCLQVGYQVFYTQRETKTS